MYHPTNTSQITPLTSAPRTRIISCVKPFSALANLKIQSSIAHCRNLPPNSAVTRTPIPQPRASIDWFKIPDHENTCLCRRESLNGLFFILQLRLRHETWSGWCFPGFEAPFLPWFFQIQWLVIVVLNNTYTTPTGSAAAQACRVCTHCFVTAARASWVLTLEFTHTCFLSSTLISK